VRSLIEGNVENLRSPGNPPAGRVACRAPESES
jgi:hypothetical protein